MVIRRVKHKFPFSLVLFALAAVTFLTSWLQVYPRDWVERGYARRLFPAISYGFGLLADVIPFSWLDLVIAASIAILIYGVYHRRWVGLLGTASFLYLWFFWSWGLNYHRPPVAVRLGLDTSGMEKADFERFTDLAAAEINRLWPLASKAPLDRESISRMALARVERVVFKIDGTDWRTTHRVKRSLLLEPWYAAAGIDGMFNPFGHEPLVVMGPYPFELPFLMSHEVAHVRGIANEGEANLVAILATIASDDPRFKYSGWLELWRYLGCAFETARPRASSGSARHAAAGAGATNRADQQRSVGHARRPSQGQRGARGHPELFRYRCARRRQPAAMEGVRVGVLPVFPQVGREGSGAVSKGSAVSQVESPCRGVQLEAPANVHEELSFVENVGSVKRASAIHKDDPLQVHVGEVQDVKEGQPADQTVEGDIGE